MHLPTWFIIYLIPGILMWIAFTLRNFSVVLKVPSEAFMFVAHTFLVSPILAVFWPIWVFIICLR